MKTFSSFRKRVAEKARIIAPMMAPSRQMPYIRKGKKLLPNDKCHCGSGKKYKYCCKLKGK